MTVRSIWNSERAFKTKFAFQKYIWKSAHLYVWLLRLLRLCKNTWIIWVVNYTLIQKKLIWDIIGATLIRYCQIFYDTIWSVFVVGVRSLCGATANFATPIPPPPITLSSQKPTSCKTTFSQIYFQNTFANIFCKYIFANIVW